MTLFFSHGVFFIAHKIHRIHKSAHVTLVLASGMCELNEDEYEDENCLRGVCFNLTQTTQTLQTFALALLVLAYIAFLFI